MQYPNPVIEEMSFIIPILYLRKLRLKDIRQDFPGGPVVTGSVPGSGRFHMPWES